MTEEERKSYDRQVEETIRAFQAFTVYLDMGYKRSLAKASYVFYGSKGKSSGNIRQFEVWSSKYGWVKRVEDYDMDILKEHSDMVKAERIKAIDDAVQISSKLKELGMAKLDQMEEEEDRLTKDQARKFLELGANLHLDVTDAKGKNKTVEVGNEVKEVWVKWMDEDEKEGE